MKKEALFLAASKQEKIGFAGMLRLNNAAAAPLDLFRFGVVKMLNDASGVASAFHLAKIEKSLSQNCKHQKIRHLMMRIRFTPLLF